MPKADIAIVTVIPEEYQAVLVAFGRRGCQLTLDLGSARQPNQYGWMAGEFTDQYARGYQIVVALAALPGQTRATDAVTTTVRRYSPRHVLLVGIAGGFRAEGLGLGDVVISSVIYDYEYGKIATEFRPRHDFTYQVDQTLLASAAALDARDRGWTVFEEPARPPGSREPLKLRTGAIASGNKVVDDADNAFFASVLEAWPKLLAVEMEGAGAAAAIESARARGDRIGFLMVRGISDVPKAGGSQPPAAHPIDGNKVERDLWKGYAAAAAAQFTAHWLSHGWPVPPARRNRRGSDSQPPEPDEPPAPPPGAIAAASPPAVAEVLAGTSETSVWIGFKAADLLARSASRDRRLGGGDRAEAGPPPVSELKQRFARVSAALLLWPTTVDGGKWLDRDEMGALESRLSSERHSATVLLGPPGCGKSAFLARLGQRLTAAGVTVLAVKADQLRATVTTPDSLAEQLDLLLPTDQAVSAVAAAEPVVVLLDQLDALADLVDLRSERLHVLLNLVQKLSERPNVHLVCSCREFEYRHDGRLGRLGAEEVRLHPPPWDRISRLLSERGVAADDWSEGAKDLLRVPYYLSLFLARLRGPGEHPAFTSYQQLFNDLWEERVVRPGGGRAELLYELAGALADAEELWADRDRFADRHALVQSLIAADVLSPTEDGFRIGFRHQSLFEFVRAKAFARDNASIAKYVLDRQDALFVRPALWTTLNYLRRASPTVYAREFDQLWQFPSLRRHVKHLLIDFLSQVEQPPPDDREQARLVAALRDPSWRRKVLAAVTGRAVWFDLLAGAHLSAEMRKAPEEAWDVTWVLIASSAVARDRCLELIERHWLPDEGKLRHVWHTLSYFSAWDDRALALAISVVRRTDINQGEMWRLAQTIAAPLHTRAVELVAAWLDAARQRIVAAPEDKRWEHEKRLHQLLDSHTQWHEAEKFAARAPAEFVLGLWPVLRRIVTDLHNEPSERVARYTDDRIWFSRLDRREYVAYDSPDHFFLALDAAMGEFARNRPDEFAALLRQTGHLDSSLLQRLLCRGSRVVAAARPGVAFEFLMADPRRFWLGGLHDSLGDSRELIAALAPHLTDGQFARLTAAIRAWEMYLLRESAPGEQETIYARGYRFRLLSALPPARLPADVRDFLAAEAASLPLYAREAQPRTGTGLQTIGSPVSREVLFALKDEAIATLFDTFPDATGTHDPDDWMSGGSVQLSREFEELAKVHPDRAIAVMKRLRPGDQERPAACGISGLATAKRPLGEILGVVEDLDARGFAGREFRESVAFTLSAISTENGLSDATCALLDRWRLAEWPDNEREEDEPGREREGARPASILWSHLGGFGPPGGRYPVLRALTWGYLRREPPATERWLDVLVDHVERVESLTNWRALCIDLVNVRCCSDRTRAGAFLARLFERFPGVLGCQLGVRLLGHVAYMLTDAQRQRAYETVLGWGAESGPQAFGELVCLRHLASPDDAWARSQLEEALTGPAATDREWVRVGIAFAAANLWKEPEGRARATELLVRLLPLPGAAIAHAVMSVFHAREELPLDEPTLALFRRIAEHPDVLARADIDEDFFDHLLDAFVVDPELVCRISEEAVRRRGSELQSVQHRFFMAGSALIDISLRLQRSGGAFRGRGLALFEALLDLGVSEAVGVARSTDHRLAPGGPSFRRPRRHRPG